MEDAMETETEYGGSMKLVRTPAVRDDGMGTCEVPE
jgi:hypothetical protein